MKIQVYTAICGEEYERRLPPRTDIPCFHSAGIFARPEMEAERYKLLGHLFFPKADILIWVDGNIRPKLSPEEMVEKFLGRWDVAMFKHPVRDCLFDELDEMRKIPRFNRDPFLMRAFDEQEREYRPIIQHHAGLWETGFIIRWNNPDVNEVFNAWWAEVCRFHWRNQTSLPAVLYDVDMRTIDEGDIRQHPAFEYRKMEA